MMKKTLEEDENFLINEKYLVLSNH